METATATANTAEAPTPAVTEISAGQIVAKMLRQEGIRHIFTISGGHIVDIYNGCIDEGIEIVDVRHDLLVFHGLHRIAGPRPFRQDVGQWRTALGLRRPVAFAAGS